MGQFGLNHEDNIAENNYLLLHKELKRYQQLLKFIDSRLSTWKERTNINNISTISADDYYGLISKIAEMQDQFNFASKQIKTQVNELNTPHLKENQLSGITKSFEILLDDIIQFKKQSSSNQLRLSYLMLSNILVLITFKDFIAGLSELFETIRSLGRDEDKTKIVLSHASNIRNLAMTIDFNKYIKAAEQHYRSIINESKITSSQQNRRLSFFRELTSPIKQEVSEASMSASKPNKI